MPLTGYSRFALTLMTPFAPVFILGITPRCGTNFLMELLCLHPDIERMSRLDEDNLLFEAHLLRLYADLTAQRWREAWGLNVSPARDLLLRSLGDGIRDFLRQLHLKESGGDVPQRLLVKTPMVDNLDIFFRILPESALLLVVRDGRDVVESAVRSFGWSYEQATRLWRDGARTVLEFDRQEQARRSQYLILKYEDLLARPPEQVARVLTFLSVDPAKYDFAKMDQLPVYGSSRTQSEDAPWEWVVDQKGPDFRPTGRWRQWSPYRRQRFYRVAGSCLAELGYEVDAEDAPGWCWTLLHWWIDRWENVRLDLPPFVRRARAIVWLLIRPRTPHRVVRPMNDHSHL